MNIQQIANDFYITGQLHPDHLEMISNHGIRSVICNRPDDESFGQHNFEAIENAARAAGVEAKHIPIVHGAAGLAEFNAFAEALKSLPGPILAYCASGARSAAMYGAVTETAA